jgi:multidrug efflux system outer membrane protein
VQRRAILILTGRVVEPTVNINVAASPSAWRRPCPPALPGELLARGGPTCARRRPRMRSAAGRQDVAGPGLLPDLHLLTPGLGWSKSVAARVRDRDPNWTTIGGSVTQPVLSIPRLLADLKAQNARTEQAVIAYEKAVQTAFGEAEGALVQLDADRRRVVLLTEGEVRARGPTGRRRMGYDRGLTDLESTLTAEQSWRVIRAQLTAAQVQSLRRSVQAYQAIGGGWTGADTQTLRRSKAADDA